MPKLAVLGRPVGHSRSPAMHNAALAELGLAGEWSYEAIEVDPSGFEARVLAMPQEGFAGANVTIPHKVAALGLADTASDAAGEIGAANTLSFTAGAIAADNTDASGFLAAVGEVPAGTRALVLGAGGASRAVVWALRRAGTEVGVWNRTPERAQALTSELGAVFVASPRAVLAGEGVSLLVNTTSIGLERAGPDVDEDLKALGLDADLLSETHTVVDLAYGPGGTALIAAARRRGARTVDGISVLVHQGAASLRIWTGAEAPLAVMEEAARR